MELGALILLLVTIAVVVAILMGLVGYATLLERKVAAWVQDRKGPNRAGPLGLLQPIADGAKFLLKEEVIPGNVDKLFYLLGPALAMGTALWAFAVVPFGPTYREDPTYRDHPVPWPHTVKDEQDLKDRDRQQAAEEGRKTYDERVAASKEYQFVIAPNIDIGIVFIFAIGSLNVYSVILAGWASNNKYSFMGAMRASAQVISYEIPLGLSVLGVLLITGSLNLERIIAYQIDNGWNILFQPTAALLFVVAIFAECNRLPFDLPECEQELVAGYHTEYSGLKFGLFMLGEYTHMFTTSFLVMILFFGGWHLPFLADVGGFFGAVLKILIIMGKVSLFIFFYMLVRWTIPRFRFDQLMSLAWRVLIPLALLHLLAVMVIKHLMVTFERPGLVWLLLPMSLGLLIGAGYVTLLLPKPASASTRPLRAAAPAETAVR